MFQASSPTVSTMQIQNAFSFYFVTWAFHCEVPCKEHLAGFDMKVVFPLSLFPFFFISPLILSMILLFLTVFWEDKDPFQRHFHILILLSTNQILIYLGEARVVKECLLRRQTP